MRDIGHSFHSDDSCVNICPNDDPDQRDSIYVTGPSGTGKSTWIGQFIAEYKLKYPKRKVILFSAKPSDPVLDAHHVIRIPVDYENMVANPVELDELEKSLTLFDDIDQFGDKEVQHGIYKLRDQILEVGRSKGISIITVSH